MNETPFSNAPLDPRTTISVEEFGHRGAIRSLSGAWESLAARSNESGPFALPEWFAVYAADLAHATGALRVMVAHRSGEVAALLPLLVEQRRMAGTAARVVRSLSDDHSQRFDLITDAGDARETVAALFSHLAADESWDVLELRDVPDDSPRAAHLLACAEAAGFLVGRWPSQRSPFLPLPPTIAQLDAALDAKFRANLRRRARRLAETLGPIALERVARGPALDTALDEGFALEASGWKGARGTAVRLDTRLMARYRSLAHAFAARGELSLHFLRGGERRIAFHFAIERAGVYYLFKPGYDHALARFGLGHLLVDAVARALIIRGARAIDFLGDDLDWKRAWTTRARPHSFLYVLRPTARGRLLWTWKFRVAPLVRRGLERLRRHLPASAAAVEEPA